MGYYEEQVNVTLRDLAKLELPDSAPTLVIVCGPSGAGKSTFAGELVQHLKCAVVDLDRYYRDEQEVPVVNVGGTLQRLWDCPEAIDWTFLERSLDSFAMGHSTITVPDFSFELNRRVGSEELAITRSDMIVLDGTLAGFAHRHLNCSLSMRSLAIYIDAPPGLRTARTMTRDRIDRRPLESPGEHAARWSLITLGEARWVSLQRDFVDRVFR